MRILPHTTLKLIYYWTITIVIALIIVPLFMDGMFADSLLYSSVGHNQALGKGTFWFPWFSKLSLNGRPTFHEQPPLLFYIQSLFFKALGSSIYVDRFYVLVCLLLNYFGMYKIWHAVVEKQFAYHYWLPVLCYAICPVVHWSFTNTVNEVGMNVFTIWAIYYFIKAHQTKMPYGYLLLGAAFVICAGLSKGVPGFFSIAAPFVINAVHKKWGSAVVQSLFTLAAIIIFFSLLLYFNPIAASSLKIYFYEHLLARVNSAPTVSNRFEILLVAFGDLLPITLMGLLFYWLCKRANFKVAAINKWAWILIAIGICGILPLTLTKVQRGFYYLCGVAPLLLGASILLVPYAHFLLKKYCDKLYLNKRIQWITFGTLFLALCLTIALSGKPKRDKNVLQDIKNIKTYCGNITEMSTRVKVFDDWGFQQYMMRYNSISLDHIDTTLPYFLIYKNEVPPLDTAYKKVTLQLNNFDLYYRNKP
jgi:Dolichyl-phosphate-mannose-protein mannosyltransferase